MKSSIKYIFLAAILLWCYCPLFAQIEIVIAPNVQKSLSAAKKCGENVTIAFQIKEWYGNLQQRWLANQNLKVDLLEGNKVVSSSKLQSDNEGRLVVSGTLKESGTLTCRISLVDEWENKVIWTKDVTSVQFGDAKNMVAKTTSQIAEKQTSPKLSSDKPAANEAKQDAPSVPVQTELPVPNLSGFKDEVCHLLKRI